MTIPDYQTLMLPVLETSANGEITNSFAKDQLAKQFGLTKEELEETLPSGKQDRFSNRVNWAKSYLKQAGLIKATKRAHFIITERGEEVLANKIEKIDVNFLNQFDEFQEFRARKATDTKSNQPSLEVDAVATPDEALREAHKSINDALAADILDRVRQTSPVFFEQLIVDLLLAMGYGGTSEDAGRALGQSGDNGIDGVIDQDPLGVDQIYIQAKDMQQIIQLGLVH